MQTLSLFGSVLPAPTLAAASMREIFNDLALRIGSDWKVLALYYLVIAGFGLLSFFMAGKALEEPEEPVYFGAAVRAWLVSLVMFIVISFLVGLGIGFSMGFMQARGTLSPSVISMMPLITNGLILLLTAITISTCLSKFYNFFSGSAIVGMLIVLVGVGLSFLLMNFVLRDPIARLNENLKGWPRETLHRQAQQPGAAAVFNVLERRAADRNSTLAERQVALRELFAKLEEMRATITSTQAPEAAEYEKHRARYEQILAELRADAATGAR